MVHVMVDIETLGTRTHAAILQIGAVAFEPKSGGRIYNNTAFNRYSKLNNDMGSVDHNTLEFWMGQEGESRKALVEGMQSAKDLSQVLLELMQWPQIHLDCEWAEIDGVWAKPPDFDLTILKSSYERHGLKEPWEFHTTRCLRTLIFMAGGQPEVDMTGFTKHDALDDAIVQAMQVQMIMGGGRK